MDDISSSIAKASRRIPATWRQLQTLVALIDWPSAKARFQMLGIPRHYFEHEPCQVVARWALTGAIEPVPANVYAALSVPDGPGFMPLIDAIALFRQGREDWALIDIDRHATAYAVRWLPEYMRYWGDRMASGDAQLADAALQLDQLLTLVRPLVLAAAAEEAA